MRYILLLILFFCFHPGAQGQTSEKLVKGTVSFISAQSIYVKFENTAGINTGDTLFVSRNNQLLPALTVLNISSISCVCKEITTTGLTLSTPIFAKIEEIVKQEEPTITEATEPKSANDKTIKDLTQNSRIKISKSRFDGKLSLASYSNYSSSSTDYRLRYNLSFNADRMGNSKFSSESYITLTHKASEFSDIGQDINKYLKIYSLALKYDFTPSSNLSIGRKINMNMANIGAVDGLQFEVTHKNITYGIVAGSRPDYFDYSFNPNLLQFGAFVGHNKQTSQGNIQTSVALFDQMNNFKTDRRFAYFQHNNSLMKNVDLFCSMEFDFYTLKNGQPATTFDLTSTYASIRIKPFSTLSFSVSYDARKNIYYYETFKNQIDSIIDRETRQGLRFNFNFRPFKNLTWGGSAGYRFQKSDPVPSVNANSFLSYYQIPGIQGSATFSTTYLKTSYMEGMVYGVSLTHDLLSGKLYSELQYRRVDYLYRNSNTKLSQDIGQISLYIRVTKKLTLSADYEATYEKENNYQRLFVNVTQRF
jgi:hypothetical protein